jgi:hypothetical protein
MIGYQYNDLLSGNDRLLLYDPLWRLWLTNSAPYRYRTVRGTTYLKRCWPSISSITSHRWPHTNTRDGVCIDVYRLNPFGIGFEAICWLCHTWKTCIVWRLALNTWPGRYAPSFLMRTGSWLPHPHQSTQYKVEKKRVLSRTSDLSAPAPG